MFDDDTPPDSTRGRRDIEMLDRECRDRHRRSAELANHAKDRAEANWSRLVALSGEDGDNGIVGTLRAANDDKEARMRKLEDAVIKGRVLGGVAIAVCTALMTWALQHFGG